MSRRKGNTNEVAYSLTMLATGGYAAGVGASAGRMGGGEQSVSRDLGTVKVCFISSFPLMPVLERGARWDVRLGPARCVHLTRRVSFAAV